MRGVTDPDDDEVRIAQLENRIRAGGLALGLLRLANEARQAEWDKAGGIDLSYRSNELAGEVGEACNVIKKLERERLGIRGSRASLQQLAEELADVVICTDLIAMQTGIDLGAAVIAKFNATSEKVGLSTRLDLGAALPPTRVDRADALLEQLRRRQDCDFYGRGNPACGDCLKCLRAKVVELDRLQARYDANVVERTQLQQQRLELERIAAAANAETERLRADLAAARADAERYLANIEARQKEFTAIVDRCLAAERALSGLPFAVYVTDSTDPNRAIAAFEYSDMARQWAERNYPARFRIAAPTGAPAEAKAPVRGSWTPEAKAETCTCPPNGHGHAAWCPKVSPVTAPATSARPREFCERVEGCMWPKGHPGDVHCRTWSSSGPEFSVAWSLAALCPHANVPSECNACAAETPR